MEEDDATYHIHVEERTMPAREEWLCRARCLGSRREKEMRCEIWNFYIPGQAKYKRKKKEWGTEESLSGPMR